MEALLKQELSEDETDGEIMKDKGVPLGSKDKGGDDEDDDNGCGGVDRAARGVGVGAGTPPTIPREIS